MWKHWFADHPLTPLALAAMALFLGAFVVVAWRAWKMPARDLDERARLPLLDDGETRHGH
jgi:cbb3-type cytochrome oxidase subunit 3